MRIEYYANGRKRRITVQDLPEKSRRAGRRSARHPMTFPFAPQAEGPEVMSMLVAGPAAALSRLPVLEERRPLIAPVEAGEPTVIPTETISLGGARSSEVTWLRREYGLRVVEEGSHGKVLLGVPADADDPVRVAVRAAAACYERGNVASAQPNFLRLMQRPEPASADATTQWALDNHGSPGVVGADVAAQAAWTISEGVAEVRVAVLDEGVDTSHPFLKKVVVAERDFVEDHPTAMPDGDDAHGTACAGIAVSRDAAVRGLAPGVSLVACRIGKRQAGAWLADDFQVSDAIDWCWDDAAADVLSNSWGGGPPSDLVTGAFERARTQGRGGRGAVVIVAAGNTQSSVLYPGNLPEILTVGASNQWDERKTRTSRDGEDWWGSNVGKGLDLMAPGVQILTTDISGAAGYSNGPTTGRFNGTSAATPLVAAAAALVLSVAPALGEGDVRSTLIQTTDSMGPTGWNQEVGFGRLDVFRSLRTARRR